MCMVCWILLGPGSPGEYVREGAKELERRNGRVFAAVRLRDTAHNSLRTIPESFGKPTSSDNLWWILMLPYKNRDAKLLASLFSFAGKLLKNLFQYKPFE